MSARYFTNLGSNTSAWEPITQTDHGIAITRSSGAIDATAAGTTGQVLTGATGANPGWQPGAGWRYITAIAPSAGSIIFDLTTMTTVGTFLRFVGQTLFPLLSEAIYMLVSTDGVNYAVANYYSGINYSDYNSTVLTNNNSNTSLLLGPAVHQTGQGYGISFDLLGMPYLGGYSGSGFGIHGTSCCGDFSTNHWFYSTVNGVYIQGAQVVKIKITSASGLINAGGMLIFQSYA